MSNISFACKKIDLADLIKCSFDLNKTEYALFMFLLEQKEELCASTLGSMMSKDRTTVQKAIKKLVEKDLVEKHQANLDNGGYTFMYTIKDKEFIRKTILSIVEGWYGGVVKTISAW